MASKPKAAAFAASTAVALIALSTLVAATQSEAGFMFAAPAAIQPLLDAGDAEINNEYVNPDNAAEFAARATTQGINKAMTEARNATTSDTAKTAPAAAPSGPVTYARAVRPMTPVKRQGGHRGATYPFDDLAAPTTDASGAKQVDGFVVPATAAKPEPWDSLGSAVSAATRRYATKTGEKSIVIKGKVKDGVQQPDKTQLRGEYSYTRKFNLVKGDGPDGNGGTTTGAWVERVQ